MAARIWDDPACYGAATRALHWGMAALFAWQFVGAILRVLAKDSAIAGFFWSTHVTLGFTLWLLVLARGAWGSPISRAVRATRDRRRAPWRPRWAIWRSMP